MAELNIEVIPIWKVLVRNNWHVNQGTDVIIDPVSGGIGLYFKEDVWINRTPKAAIYYVAGVVPNSLSFVPVFQKDIDQVNNARLIEVQVTVNNIYYTRTDLVLQEPLHAPDHREGIFHSWIISIVRRGIGIELVISGNW